MRDLEHLRYVYRYLPAVNIWRNAHCYGCAARMQTVTTVGLQRYYRCYRLINPCDYYLFYVRNYVTDDPCRCPFPR